MKMKVLVFSGLLFFISCNVYQNVSDKDLTGTFTHFSRGSIKGFDFRYELILKKNNEFILSIHGHYNPTCTGSWMRKKDSIILKCSEVKDLTEVLSSGYMDKRNHIVKIVNKNKLLLNNKVVLKRK